VAHKIYFNCATESEVFKMSPRTGRPKALQPKTIEVKARIDEKTNDRLNQYCEKHNVTRTDVVRKGIENVLDKEKE
jgi:hypothetical protein